MLTILSVLSVLSITTADRLAYGGHGGCMDIHAAAFMDEPKELIDLLDGGGDPNCRDSLDQTPLITAAASASLLAVETLLANGVEVNARDEIGETALTKARTKFAYFDMTGGEGFQDLMGRMIAKLESAGAKE